MSFKKISILGGGNLGASITKGMLKSGYTDPKSITVTRRRIHLLQEFADLGVNITMDNASAVKGADLVILAVKPHQISDLLDEISSEVIASGPVVASVITGVESSLISTKLPGIDVVRAMPNTAIALGESMTCVSGQGSSLEEVREFFDHFGKSIVINEELMGAATVIGACGIAFALRFMRSMAQGGIEIGFGAEVSQLITAQTIKGATQLILESNNHPEKEIDRVTTPMGVTISGLNEMEHQGFSSAVIKGLLTSYNKLDSL